MNKLLILALLSFSLAAPAAVWSAEETKPAHKCCEMKKGEACDCIKQCGCEKDTSTCTCDCGCGEAKSGANPAPKK